jgi:hypothetical protein
MSTSSGRDSSSLKTTIMANMFGALNRFISRLDADPQAQKQSGASDTYGFQVLRNNNPELPLEPWFDSIIGINGRTIVRANNISYNIFQQLSDSRTTLSPACSFRNFATAPVPISAWESTAPKDSKFAKSSSRFRQTARRWVSHCSGHHSRQPKPCGIFSMLSPTRPQTSLAYCPIAIMSLEVQKA